MDAKRLVGNVGVAFCAQGVSMFVSILVSLLVPKVLGVVEFGYWQLFLFYAGYVGFFHFGLNDGVYLLNGGMSRAEIDKRQIGSQFLVAVVSQVVIALGIAAFALADGENEDREFVLLAVSIYLVLNNASGFLGYVFQALNETKLFSFSTVLDRASFLVPLIVLLVMQCDDFRLYVMFYAFSRALCLFYCLFKARDILSAGFLGPKAALRDSVESAKAGIKLMIANIASMLILGVMRFAVDAGWGIEEFSRISFALTMVNFFLTFISQVAMVLFPALRQSSERERAGFFGSLSSVLNLFLPGVYILCFPVTGLLSLWLPQYASSMSLFALLLPICVFDAKMQLLGTTYFKVLRMEKRLLSVNLVTMVFSAGGVLLGWLVLHSLEFMILVPVVAIMSRSFASECMISKKVGAHVPAAFYGGALLTVLFLALSLFLPAWMAWCSYSVAYFVFLWINRQLFHSVMSRLSRATELVRH